MGRYRGGVPRARGGAAGSTSTLLIRTLSLTLHLHPHPPPSTLTLTLTQIRWATRSPYISPTSPLHLPYISVQVGYEIHWKEGMDVTVKMVQKKQKKKGKTRTVQVGEIPSPPPHHHRHLTTTTATSPPPPPHRHHRHLTASSPPHCAPCRRWRSRPTPSSSSSTRPSRPRRRWTRRRWSDPFAFQYLIIFILTMYSSVKQHTFFKFLLCPSFK